MSQCNDSAHFCGEWVLDYLSGELGNDRAKADEFVEKLRPIVRSAVRHQLRFASDIAREDAEQAIFLRVFQKLSLWDRRVPFCRWVRVVAAHCLIDQLRASRARKQFMTRLRAERLHEQSASQRLEEDGRPHSPEIDVDRSVGQVLAAVPEDWQTAYIEVVRYRKPHKEIAKNLNRSVRTIRYWLAEMRQRLNQSHNVYRNKQS